MARFVGLDVSQKLTSICVVDDAGRRLWRGQCHSEPEPIERAVRRHAGDDASIGIETGPMTPWLVHELRGRGLNVVCLDARHASAALKMQMNKTDQNDAEGLAQIMRTGWYRSVHVKSLENRHRSREFVGFLKKLDAAYPTDTAIKLILDNHSAHISKETKTWLAAQPEGRFTFVFTPKHGSWLNLVEGFFSKMARSVLRRIRVASKNELKARILAYLDDLNREPVIHTWTYKIDTAA